MATTQIRGNTQIMAATITDAQIAAAAAIASSKLADGANWIKKDGTVAMAATLQMGSGTPSAPVGPNQISQVADPTNAQDAATKHYVDVAVSGIASAGASALVATVGANITLSGTQTIDGVALSAGNIVLVKDQTTQANNGLYTVAAGAWTRAPQMSSWAQVPGMIISVETGTTLHDTVWLSTADPGGTLNTTAITFTQIPGPSDIQPGAGLSRTGQALNVVNGDNSITVTGSAPAGGNIKVNQGVVLLKQDYVVRETPAGTVNGVNTVFTLANTPSGSNEMVFLNGILQEPGSGNDYTISGLTITFISAPLTNDRIRVTYLKGTATTAP